MATAGLNPAEQHLLSNWPYDIVDWKWEYMTDMWERLTICIELFLSRFDAKAFKTSNTKEDEETIDLKCIRNIEEAQRDIANFSLRTEMYRLFAREVAKQLGWHKGCDCHDWIWVKRISLKRKK